MVPGGVDSFRLQIGIKARGVMQFFYSIGSKKTIRAIAVVMETRGRGLSAVLLCAIST